MRRAQALAAASDLKLLVLDIRTATDPDPDTLALVDAETLVVLNKRDLVEGDGPDHVAGRPTLAVSARTGAGMVALEATLRQEVADRFGTGEGSPVITRARHRRALEECAAALDRAAAAPMAELAAEDLRLALRALGRIAGRVDVEDLLDVIFRDFCIGK
jgi:tRNA modification GTPase